ncbi:MAG: hypothetical protein Q8N47_26535 [Bryobacterales bacterium]|nr:hypothetical protein [Bryobacterales bacterium]
MSKLAQTHPSEEVLEEYALGRLTGPKLEQFEEHLLVCAQCQDGLEETDRFIVGIKQAAGTAPRPERKRFGRFKLLSKPVWAGALAAAALAVVVWMPRQPAAGYDAEVSLQAMRGAEAVAPAVPAGKPFLLKADVKGLPPASEFRLEVADSGGAVVWRATVSPKDALISTVVARKLGAGRYWVRLYDPAGALVREYGLESR